MRRFVILEHSWNGVHWDLMLEEKDALRTWALESPLAEGRCVPARSLADHRRVYLDYEGPVSGNRGSVRRVESGTYKALCWSEDRVVVRLQASALKGELELRRSVTPGVSDRWEARLGKVD